MSSTYINSQALLGVSGEQYIIEDLMNEVIHNFGIDAYLIPRDENTPFDMVYGEDPLKTFKKNFGIEVYINNPTQWDGVGDFFSKFGLEFRDDSNIIVTRRMFMRRVPTIYNQQGGGPREGDLIWIPLTNALVEIKNTNEEKSFYMLGRKVPYFYEMRCERFRYSNEKFTTGLDDVDSQLIDHGYLIQFNLSTTGNGFYTKYETVYQSPTPLPLDQIALVNATAVVEEYDSSRAILNVAHTKGVFTANIPIWGANSNASYVLISYDDMMDVREDTIIDNRRLEIEGNNIIDFTVQNPFGTP